jgi:hypothetical protein
LAELGTRRSFARLAAAVLCFAPTACGVRRCSDAVHGSLAVAKCDGALFVERAEAGRGSLADHV